MGLIEASARALAAVWGDAADVQTAEELRAAFRHLEWALLAEAGETPPGWPPIGDQRVAAGMIDTSYGVTVSAKAADRLISILRPVAASHRLRGGGQGDWVFATVCEQAAARLGVASAHDRVAESPEVVSHELQLHEAECPFDPVVPLEPMICCPCGQIAIVRCSKCGTAMRTMIFNEVRCAHVDDLVTGNIDAWLEVLDG